LDLIFYFLFPVLTLLFNFAVVSSLNGLCAGLAEQGAVNCSELEECLGSTRQAKNAKTPDAPAKKTQAVENGSAAPLFTLTEETYEDNSIDEQLSPTAGDSNTLDVADECVGILCLTICTLGSQKTFIVLELIFLFFKFPFCRFRWDGVVHCLLHQHNRNSVDHLNPVGAAGSSPCSTNK
jgi:hypothetical protein